MQRIYLAHSMPVAYQICSYEVKTLSDAFILRPNRCVSVFGGYSLAMRRNLGHSGAKTAAMMITGFDGGPAADQMVQAHAVSDKKTIFIWEHRLAAAKFIKSMHSYQDWEADLGFEVHEWRADATHEESVEKAKVHLAIIASCMASKHDVDLLDAGGPWWTSEHADEFEKQLFTITTMADMLKVQTGKSDELYEFAKRQFESVGAVHWESRHVWESRNRFVLTVFILVTDAGGENVGFRNRLLRYLTACPNIMVIMQWCMLHQGHLIGKALLKVLDSFRWSSGALPVNYYTGVASTSNQWRSTGTGWKLRQAAVSMYGEEIADRHFRRF